MNREQMFGNSSPRTEHASLRQKIPLSRVIDRFCHFITALRILRHVSRYSCSNGWRSHSSPQCISTTVLVVMGLPSLRGYLMPKTNMLGLSAVFLIFYGLTTPMTAFPLQLFLQALAADPAAQASANDIGSIPLCYDQIFVTIWAKFY